MNKKQIISEFMAERGRNGAKKQAAAMTQQERTERARHAAKTRWAKKNPLNTR